MVTAALPNQYRDCSADSVVVWVAILESGRERADAQVIIHARENLARLGVEVRYTTPKVPKGYPPTRRGRLGER